MAELADFRQALIDLALLDPSEELSVSTMRKMQGRHVSR